MDTSGMIIAGNKAILQALNKQANELSGVHVSSLGQRSELENRKAKALEVIALKKAVRREERVDEKWFDTTIAPVTDSEGTVTRLAVFSRDITDQKRAEEERRRMEAQLSHSQKMEAIGTLAGGIAHDFNNLTQAILGYTEILLMERDPYDPDSAKLREIERAVKRASDLTQQLLTFSRKVESKAKPMDLNQSVRNVEKLLRRTIPRMIDVETDLAKDLKSINADPAQIEQILMNLGVNARDAMPEGGRLLIKTENANLDPGYCRVHPECLPGEYVLLTFSDTGQGMGEDVLTHIFEPFFTTKEIGKGTGLGLATVYGLVKNHQGHISCESELGKGTIFRIYLPSLETQAPELHDKAKVEPLPPGGSETILFVDDEESLQFLAEEVLTKMGYRLLKAWNGEQAITLYKANKEDISLVILDVIMPGMGGKRCLAELMKLDPMAKIIVASGYTDEEPKENFLKMGAKEFLSKPYKMKSILDVVRKVLDEA
jgi:two-component system cell cycle sensor histidine kinase/response regulator CckA